MFRSFNKMHFVFRWLRERATLLRYVYVVYLVKVKQSHYRPGQALRAAGGWVSQISRQSAHEGGKVVSPTHRPPLPAREYSLYSLRGCVDPRSIVRPEGLSEWNIPMAISGIEPATFRLVAQCLSQLRHRVPGVSLVKHVNNFVLRIRIKIWNTCSMDYEYTEGGCRLPCMLGGCR
jgi:hypothetical protein